MLLSLLYVFPFQRSLILIRLNEHLRLEVLSKNNTTPLIAGTYSSADQSQMSFQSTRLNALRLRCDGFIR